MKKTLLPLVFALLLAALPARAETLGPFEPAAYPDLLRVKDVLWLSEQVEAYYAKTGHYPLAGEPQAEMIVVPVTTYSMQSAQPDKTHEELAAALQKELGPDFKLRFDPSNGQQGIELRIYQYATDGQDYYVSANLTSPVFYGRRLDDTHYMVEATSHPNPRDLQYSPAQLRHYMKHGPDTLARQMPLAVALASRDFAGAKEALADGANPSPPCEFQTRCQPLADAARDGDIETMAFLLDNGADINGFTAFYDVALTSALSAGKKDAAKFLLEKGAKVNLPNAFGATPFIGALAAGDRDMAELMLAKGAHLNRRYLVLNSDAQPGELGDRPLEAAIRSKNPALVKLLLDKGADASLTGHAGATMLDLAMGTGSAEISGLIKSATKK